jgi:signal transduction histidine kinase/CheY-like chemotaxis protein
MAMGGVIGGIALLLAWLSARNLARAVTQPLQHLSNTVTALTRGNLHARCGNCGKYEITTLAADIDRMAQRLQDSHALNEERVRGATAEALEQLAQAKQATQARTRFLATASHDLRQPVHAMGLFVDTLLPGAAPPQIPSLLRLREATEAMSTMLDTLLYISRLDANVMSPEPKPVLVADLLEQLDAMHAAAAHEAGITLHWLANTKIIMTDHSLALRVLDNLVRNAVLHSAGTRVAIVARRCGNDCVRIEVRDNGVGIASILQNRIFEEFYQVGNQQRDRRNGLGLGLSICARIAQLLGTKITLRSQLHRGSAFALTFPAASPAALSTSTASAATYSAITAHCLLIDNDDAIVEGTTALLTQWGCQVTAARTLEQTLTLLHEQGPYDIVLCDLQLHEHDDGFEIIHHAQQLYPNALTVLISGTTTSDMLQRAQQASVTLLTKPVAPAKLRALLAARKAQ